MWDKNGVYARAFFEGHFDLISYGTLPIAQKTKPLSLRAIAQGLKGALDEFTAEMGLDRGNTAVFIEQQADLSRAIDVIEAQLHLYFVDYKCFTVGNQKKNTVCLDPSLAHNVFVAENKARALEPKKKPLPPRQVRKKHTVANFKHYLAEYKGGQGYEGHKGRAPDAADSFMQILGQITILNNETLFGPHV
jgi:hypothetical protein